MSMRGRLNGVFEFAGFLSVPSVPEGPNSRDICFSLSPCYFTINPFSLKKKKKKQKKKNLPRAVTLPIKPNSMEMQYYS